MKKQTLMTKIGLTIGVMVLATSVLPSAGALPVEASEVKSSATKTFPDVKNFHEEISYLTSLGIIHGHTDGTFKPLDSLKRVHAVQMVLREMGVAKEGASNPGFVDMKPGTYGYDEVAKAVEMGFIHGETNAKGQKVFNPNGTLTRGQMAKILTEAYKITEDNDVTFTDVSARHWTKEYVSRLATANITVGYPDGTFKPNDKIQRQHFSAFMARHLNPEFKPEPVKPKPVAPTKATFLSKTNSDKILTSAISTDGTGNKLFKKDGSAYYATLLFSTDPSFSARYNAVFVYHDSTKAVNLMVNTKVYRDNPHLQGEGDKAILVATQSFFGAGNSASNELLAVIKNNMNGSGYTEKTVTIGSHTATVNISPFDVDIRFN